MSGGAGYGWQAGHATLTLFILFVLPLSFIAGLATPRT